MSPTSSAFRKPSVLLAATIGNSSGAGVRVGFAPILELSVEVRVGVSWLPLLMDKHTTRPGFDLRYRPMGLPFGTNPSVRIGYTGQRVDFGARPGANSAAEEADATVWFHYAVVAIGFETREKNGLTVGCDIGGQVEITTPAALELGRYREDRLSTSALVVTIYLGMSLTGT